jgi:hypothetical protein
MIFSFFINENELFAEYSLSIIRSLLRRDEQITYLIGITYF